MHLTFLCGSLEPDRDGIGDYTRRLALSCREQGIAANIIALNDHHLSEVREENDILSTLRLPATLPWSEKRSRLQSVIGQTKSNWLSLQYSPYSYHPRGIASPLTTLFRTPGSSTKTHIMFHEIWIGLDKDSPWKHRLIGRWQRHCLHRFLKESHPRVIHTHTPLYQKQLQALGYSAELLPLFGNIELCTDNRLKLETIELVRHHLPQWSPTATGNPCRLLLFFGTLHREWDPLPFTQLLNSCQADYPGKIAVLHVGHNAHTAQWTALTGKLDKNISTASLGPQPADVISCLLSLADFGLTTTPEAYLYKSGTTASMHEHGLPVFVLRSNKDTLPAPYRHPSQLLQLLKNPPQRVPSGDTLPAVTQQFLHSLQV